MSSKNGNSTSGRSIPDVGFSQTRLVFKIKGPYYLIERLVKVSWAEEAINKKGSAFCGNRLFIDRTVGR